MLINGVPISAIDQSKRHDEHINGVHISAIDQSKRHDEHINGVHISPIDQSKHHVLESKASADVCVHDGQGSDHESESVQERGDHESEFVEDVRACARTRDVCVCESDSEGTCAESAGVKIAMLDWFTFDDEDADRLGMYVCLHVCICIYAICECMGVGVKIAMLDWFTLMMKMLID